MRSAQFLLTIVITAACIHGQTKVDVANQGRNIDFSIAESTKPAKTGAVLPSACNVGEMFFKTDAAAGQNLYGCTASNLWVVQAAAPETAPAEFSATLSRQQMSMSPGSFRFGPTITAIKDIGTTTITGTSSGTVWIAATPAGMIVAAHNLSAGSVTVTGGGYTVTDGAAGFPVGSVPMYQCPVIEGTFGTCTDYRASMGSDPIVGGPSGTINVSCAGSPCTVDVEPMAVPTKTGTNVFTGLNSFSQLLLPVVGALAPGDCNEVSEVGRGVVLSTAPSGQQWYVCEQTEPGVFAWRQQGGAGVADGNKGDLTVSNTGTIWTVNALPPSRVGLGNVQNYGTCSQTQAESGTATDCNMTAERTAQAIALQPRIIDGDKGDVTVSNSGTTWTVDTLPSSRVGLASVQNYGTCTQAQAEAGAATDCNMTAQRTSQAITALGAGAPKTWVDRQIIPWSSSNNAWNTPSANSAQTETRGPINGGPRRWFLYFPKAATPVNTSIAYFGRIPEDAVTSGNRITNIGFLMGAFNATTGNIRMQIEMKCFADGEDAIDGTGRTSFTIDVAVPATLYGSTLATAANPAPATCMQGKEFWLNITRLATDAGDTTTTSVNAYLNYLVIDFARTR